MQTAVAHNLDRSGWPPCFTGGHVTTAIEYCRHRFVIRGFFTCPFCKPTETTEPEPAMVPAAAPTEDAPRRRAGLSNNVHRPSRTLDLAGKTLAGCVVDRKAADATRQSRFHALMACGHPLILDGSALMAAHKAGRVLKCVACTKADFLALRGKKRVTQKASGDG